MSTSDTNVIEIIEAHTELRADKRISRRVKLTSNTVGLEAEDTSSNIVNIISPSGNNWVSLDRLARDTSIGETLLETLPGLSKSDFLALAESVSDEAVLSIAIGVTTSITGFRVSPVEVLTLGALSSMESKALKYFSGIEFLRVGLELWSSHSFDFFSSLTGDFTFS